MSQNGYVAFPLLSSAKSSTIAIQPKFSLSLTHTLTHAWTPFFNNSIHSIVSE